MHKFIVPCLFEMEQLSELAENIKTEFWYPTSDLKHIPLIKEMKIKEALLERWKKSVEGRWLVTPHKGQKKPEALIRCWMTIDKDGDIVVTYVGRDMGWFWGAPSKIPEQVYLDPETTLWKDVMYNEQHHIPRLPPEPDTDDQPCGDVVLDS